MWILRQSPAYCRAHGCCLWSAQSPDFHGQSLTSSAKDQDIKGLAYAHCHDFYLITANDDVDEGYQNLLDENSLTASMKQAPRVEMETTGQSQPVHRKVGCDTSAKSQGHASILRLSQPYH